MAMPDREFQLGLLPQRKINKRALATSYGFVSLLLLIVLNIGLLLPEKMQLKDYHVTELIPLPAARPEHQEIKRPRIKAKLVPPPPIFTAPKLIVPRVVVRHELPKPEEAPKVVVNQFVAPQLKMVSSGPRPQLVHTGDFGSSAPATLKTAVQQVQTGGFGDPNGLKGEGKQAAKLYAAQTGGFDMPVGPGQGNGTGGAKGLKGTVASADFGNGVATASRGNGNGAVATGGFGSEQVVHSGPRIQADAGPAASAVEITYKPNPVYTDEARSLKLEGEVLLEVMFGANGTLHVNRVVRGLGHGLDDAAVAAANKMRFKPAMRGGEAVDSTAIVHVVFQMAY